MHRKKKENLKAQTKVEMIVCLRLLECHANLDLEGFEDQGQDGEPTGIKLALCCNVRRRYKKNIIHS